MLGLEICGWGGVDIDFCCVIFIVNIIYLYVIKFEFILSIFM